MKRGERERVGINLGAYNRETEIEKFSWCTGGREGEEREHNGEREGEFVASKSKCGASLNSRASPPSSSLPSWAR